MFILSFFLFLFFFIIFFFFLYNLRTEFFTIFFFNFASLIIFFLIFVLGNRLIGSKDVGIFLWNIHNENITKSITQRAHKLILFLSPNLLISYILLITTLMNLMQTRRILQIPIIYPPIIILLIRKPIHILTQNLTKIIKINPKIKKKRGKMYLIWYFYSLIHMHLEFSMLMDISFRNIGAHSIIFVHFFFTNHTFRQLFLDLFFQHRLFHITNLRIHSRRMSA